MAERITMSLYNAQQAHQAIQTAWKHAKGWLMAGHRLVLEVRPEKRSDAQNRLLHSRINDVAKQLEWPAGSGQKHDADAIKRLLTAAWMRATGQTVQALPALDGAGVDVVFRKTSQLTKAECADLSEFIMAWGTQHGIEWCPASLGPDAWEAE